MLLLLLPLPRRSQLLLLLLLLLPSCQRPSCQRPAHCLPMPPSLTPAPARYVVGDSRFARYCKSNPRKMVKLWAEKEMRNLARLAAAGILCPRPLQLRLHVLGARARWGGARLRGQAAGPGCG